MRDDPAGAAPPSEPGGSPRRQLTPAIAAALVVLAASFALSVGFVVANGGMDLPASAASSAEVANASVAPGPGGSPGSPPSATASPSLGAPTPTSSGAATPSATTVPTPLPTTSPSPTPIPSPTAVPTVVPTIAPTPGSTSDRYALLRACPDTPDCWVYVIRSGDNLVSIARYFGVPFAAVTDLNPWTTTTQLVAGQELRLPPPTR